MPNRPRPLQVTILTPPPRTPELTFRVRVRTAAQVVGWLYLGLVPVSVAVFVVLGLLPALPHAAALWFALSLIPPYVGVSLCRPPRPADDGLQPAALALGSAGGHALGLWAASGALDDTWRVLASVACSLTGTLLMTYWPRGLSKTGDAQWTLRAGVTERRQRRPPWRALLPGHRPSPASPLPAHR